MFRSIHNHLSGPINYALGGFGLTTSLFGLIDANMVQTWVGALVAVGAVLWGFWRDQQRRDFEAGERKLLLQALVKANVSAAEKGSPIPFPEIIDILLRDEKSPEAQKEKPATDKPGGPDVFPLVISLTGNG